MPQLPLIFSVYSLLFLLARRAFCSHNKLFPNPWSTWWHAAFRWWNCALAHRGRPVGFCVSSGCHQEERLGSRINTKKGRRAAVLLFKVCIHFCDSIKNWMQLTNQDFEHWIESLCPDIKALTLHGVMQQQEYYWNAGRFKFIYIWCWFKKFTYLNCSLKWIFNVWFSQLLTLLK